MLYGMVVRLASGAGLIFFWANASLAGIGTSTLTAQTSVNSNCSAATTAVGFGSYDPIGTNKATALTASGLVTITCTQGSAPTIGLGLGQNASGSTRRMKSGATHFLTYELYRPHSTTPGAACSFPGTIVWGTAGANLFTPTAAPTKSHRSYNICGSAAGGQDPAVGTYSDSVVATITF